MMGDFGGEVVMMILVVMMVTLFSRVRKAARCLDRKETR